MASTRTITRDDMQVFYGRAIDRFIRPNMPSIVLYAGMCRQPPINDLRFSGFEVVIAKGEGYEITNFGDNYSEAFTFFLQLSNEAERAHLIEEGLIPA